MGREKVDSGFILDLSLMFKPLEDGLSSVLNFEEFLYRLGWGSSFEKAEFDQIQTFFESFSAVAETIEKLTETGNEEIDWQKLSNALRAIIDEIRKFGETEATTSLLFSPFSDVGFWEQFAKRTLDRLIYDYLVHQIPLIIAILKVFGIVKTINIPIPESLLDDVLEINDHDDGDCSFNLEDDDVIELVEIDWEGLIQIFSEPEDYLKEFYRWDITSTDFNYVRALKSIEDFFSILGIRARQERLDGQLLNSLYGATNEIKFGIPILKVPIVQELAPDFDLKNTNEFGFSFFPIPDNKDGLPVGVAISNLLNGELTHKYDNFEIFGDSIADGAVRMEITPKGINPVLTVDTMAINLGIRLTHEKETPLILIGHPKSHRLELDGFGGEISFKGRKDDLELIAGMGTGNLSKPSPNALRIVIQFNEGDGFIQKVVGTEPIEIEFSGNLKYSTKTGFTFEGQAGFEIMLPLHLELGPLELFNLKISLNAGQINNQAGLKFSTGASIGAEIGPIALSVEDIGFALNLIPQNKGKDLDLSLGFKPPKGIGLSIDASAVKGGGYLYIDTEKGTYIGAAELMIQEVVNVTAVGIINTKLPDGKEGYSFLLLISAEFCPIQLGMGFTLSGVGGLVGIHRGMLIEEISSGVKNNALDHILYPEDPVANAPTIVASLNGFFPIEQDTFTFGIMLKLGWGTPNLIDIELGLIISLPEPVKIAILGILKLVLPDAEAPVVKLQVNFIGAVDFGEKYFFFYATLFDSEILIFKVEGSMYFSIEWGSQPYFVFTIGGFHPTFKAPKLRGGIAQSDIKRLQLRLMESDNPLLLIQFYFAVTSNTVQFGAALDFKLDIEVFKVLGWFHFDALFQFNPFYFNVYLSAGLQVYMGDSPILGVAFKGTLEGPTPWRIHGYGEFGYWFITVRVNIDETFGEDKEVVQPTIKALPLLKEALLSDRSWQLVKEKSHTDTVLIREVEFATNNDSNTGASKTTMTHLVAHPDAKVICSQTKIPLNTDMVKIGEQKINDYTWFGVSASIDNDKKPDNLISTKDFFARSQFQELSNEDKISQPSFEEMESGISLGSDSLHFYAKGIVEGVLDYEMQIIDTHGFSKAFDILDTSFELLNVFELQNAVHASAIGLQTVSVLQDAEYTIINQIQPEKITAPIISAPDTFLNMSVDSLNVFDDPKNSTKYQLSELEMA